MKINNRIVKKVIRKLKKKCKPDETKCRFCWTGSLYGRCPWEKALDIQDWWKEKTKSY